MNKSYTLIGGVAILLGSLFDYLIFEHEPGLGFSLYVLSLLAGLGIVYAPLKQKPSVPVVLLSLLLIFFSSMITIRASETLTLLNALTTWCLLFLMANIAAGTSIKEKSILGYAKLVLLPFIFLGNSFQSMADVHASQKETGSTRFGEIVRGILITLPIAIFFLLIFSQADSVFDNFIGNFFEAIIDAETIIRFALVGIASLLIGGGLVYVFYKRGYKQQEVSLQQILGRSFLGNIEISILLSSINIIFLAFIIIQFTYLFSVSPSLPIEGMNPVRDILSLQGQNANNQIFISNHISNGMNYSEYTRRGFFELCIAAGAAFMMLFAIDAFAAYRKRWLSVALILQVFVVMASAFKRLYLYEQAYGFTELRFYSHAFMIWLGIIFLILLWKIARDLPEQKFLFASVIVSILALASINIINPDAFIARQNLQRYAETGKLDLEYLHTLSEDSLPAIKPVFDPSLARKHGTQDQSWQEFNLARARFNNFLNTLPTQTGL